MRKGFVRVSMQRARVLLRREQYEQQFGGVQDVTVDINSAINGQKCVVARESVFCTL